MPCMHDSELRVFCKFDLLEIGLIITILNNVNLVWSDIQFSFKYYFSKTIGG